jgi:hypothetical protein
MSLMPTASATTVQRSRWGLEASCAHRADRAGPSEEQRIEAVKAITLPI